jgi:hypothetical protein
LRRCGAFWQHGERSDTSAACLLCSVLLAQQATFVHERSAWGWVGSAAIRLRQQATLRNTLDVFRCFRRLVLPRLPAALGSGWPLQG